MQLNKLSKNQQIVRTYPQLLHFARSPSVWQGIGGLIGWLWVLGYRGLSLVWDATVNSCGYFCSIPLQRHHLTGRHHSNRGCKMPKIRRPPWQLPLSTSHNSIHWCIYGKFTAPFLSGLARNLLTSLVTPRSDSGSTSTCLWLWSYRMLPAYSYWPVWFDLILVVRSRDRPIWLFWGRYRYYIYKIFKSCFLLHWLSKVLCILCLTFFSKP